MSDGNDSNYKFVSDGSYFTEDSIPCTVGKIMVFGTDDEAAEFNGLQMFSHEGELLLKLGILQGKCV